MYLFDSPRSYLKCSNSSDLHLPDGVGDLRVLVFIFVYVFVVVFAFTCLTRHRALFYLANCMRAASAAAAAAFSFFCFCCCIINATATAEHSSVQNYANQANALASSPPYPSPSLVIVWPGSICLATFTICARVRKLAAFPMSLPLHFLASFPRPCGYIGCVCVCVRGWHNCLLSIKCPQVLLLRTRTYFNASGY